MHYSVDYVPAGVCTAASRYPYCRLYDNGGNPSNVCPASGYHVLLYGFCPCPSAAVYAVIGIVDFLFPLLLSAAGIHVLDAVSLYPLLYNESCMTSVSGMWNLLFSILGYFLFSIACYRLARSFEKHV